MNNIIAVILAVVQSITEFIPVSSAGVTKAVAFFSGADAVNAEVFSVVLHISTSVAAIFYFSKTLFELLIEAKNCFSDIITHRFSFKLSSMSENRRMFLMLLISSITAGLLLTFIFNNPFLLLEKGKYLLFGGVGFLLSGFVVFLSNSGFFNNKKSDITPLSAALIGLAQGLSMFLPGFSRLAVTTAAGSVFGVPNLKTVKYSIILNIPFSLLHGFSLFGLISGAQSLICVNHLIISFICCLVLSFFTILLISLLFKAKFFKMFGLVNTLLGVAATISGLVIIL